MPNLIATTIKLANISWICFWYNGYQWLQWFQPGWLGNGMMFFTEVVLTTIAKLPLCEIFCMKTMICFCKYMNKFWSLKADLMLFPLLTRTKDLKNPHELNKYFAAIGQITTALKIKIRKKNQEQRSVGMWLFNSICFCSKIYLTSLVFFTTYSSPFNDEIGTYDTW